MLSTLLMLSLTVSFAQTGNWYNDDECRRIASRLIRANECDTLLSMCYADIDTYETMVVNLEQVLVYKDSIISLRIDELSMCDSEVNRLNKECEKANKKRRASNIAWGTTTGVLLAALLVLLLL